MPDTDLKGSPRFQKGALVQLVKDLMGVVPNVIPFQYSPEKLSRSLTPWNPFEVDQTQRGAQAPTVQPFDSKESFNLTLEIDATNELEDGSPVAVASGIADRLAALKKLTLPAQGPIGDLAARIGWVEKMRWVSAIASTHPTMHNGHGSSRRMGRAQRNPSKTYTTPVVKVERAHGLQSDRET